MPQTESGYVSIADDRADDTATVQGVPELVPVAVVVGEEGESGRRRRLEGSAPQALRRRDIGAGPSGPPPLDGAATPG